MINWTPVYLRTSQNHNVRQNPVHTIAVSILDVTHVDSGFDVVSTQQLWTDVIKTDIKLSPCKILAVFISWKTSFTVTWYPELLWKYRSTHSGFLCGTIVDSTCDSSQISYIPKYSSRATSWRSLLMNETGCKEWILIHTQTHTILLIFKYFGGAIPQFSMGLMSLYHFNVFTYISWCFKSEQVRRHYLSKWYNSPTTIVYHWTAVSKTI